MTPHILVFPSGLSVRYDVDLHYPHGSAVTVPVLRLKFENPVDSVDAQRKAWEAIQEWAGQRGEPEHTNEEEYVTQVVPWYPPFTEKPFEMQPASTKEERHVPAPHLDLFQ
jgi:hypothetical protein